MTATRKATDCNRESTSQMFDFHLPLLGENREAKDRWSKEILSTVKLNTRLTSTRFLYQSLNSCFNSLFRKPIALVEKVLSHFEA